MEVDNPTSSFRAPLPQLAQSSPKTRERLILKGGSWAGLVGVGVGGGVGTVPSSSCVAGVSEKCRGKTGAEGPGLPVLLPGTPCLSAPACSGEVGWEEL